MQHVTFFNEPCREYGLRLPGEGACNGWQHMGYGSALCMWCGVPPDYIAEAYSMGAWHADVHAPARQCCMVALDAPRPQALLSAC